MGKNPKSEAKGSSSRTFYKRTYKIELLSEEPLRDGLSLETIAYEMTEGHCSGVVIDEGEVEMNALQVAEALIAQGSEPEFFMIDEDGNDLE